MNPVYLNKLIDQIRKLDLDALLIAPSADMLFFTGHMPMLCQRFQGLFITAKGQSFYVCNLLTGDEIRDAMPDVPVYTWFDGEGFVETVRRALADYGLIGGRIGVNNAVRAFNILEISEAMDVTFVSARLLCPEVRICKNNMEISFMREAGRIGQKALELTVKEIRAGMKEKEVKQILEGHMAQLGAERPSAMVASGPNSGFPHYNRDDRVIQPGDTVLIDFGCAVNNLCTDITRTFFMGEPSEHQKEIYGLVYDAIAAAERAFLNGERWIPYIDLAARKVIADGGYGNYFTTRLGHGMGYLAHEAPDIKQNNKRFLEPGMAFTIEPGIYIPDDMGVRIEDCLVLNPDGKAEVLTASFPKEYRIIDN